MIKLYVGCALTQAPEGFRDDVEKLKESLGGAFRVMKFLGLVAGTPKDVYQVDMIDNVGGCDVMLAICDYPSIGLGMELHEAVKVRQIPVLSVNKEGSTVTRLLTGMGEFYPNLKFATYNNLRQDVPGLVGKFVEEVAEDIWDHELGGPRWAFRSVRSYDDHK